ncbi:MAG: hypothetical protein DRJ05_12575 [Bacteroidetes bacterium]|nr:MAG: hypothetical protein DRJ05_12575 [Bacteroidota bacterium]
MQVLASCHENSSPDNWRTIPEGITAEYVAHKRIILQKGFHAEAGSHFTARLEPCLNCDNKRISGFELQDFLINYEETNTNSLKNGKSVILKNDEKSFSIYPNPSPGHFTLHFEDGESTGFEVEIIDMMGNVVYKRENMKAGNTAIDIRDKPKGIYFVKVLVDGKVYTEKVVVE